MLHRYLIAETLKLRRSLALLLVVAAPACVVALGFVIGMDRKGALPLDLWQRGTAPIWGFAMLPLAVTALSVLMAQMEHGPRNWNQLLTMPGARPHAYLAKALVMLALMAAMSALMWLYTLGAGKLLAAVRQTSGAMDPAGLARTFALMAVTSVLVCMLQLWVALRFRSFVVPLVFGILGTITAIGAFGSIKAAYFPWLLATNMLVTNRPELVAKALLIGGAGGLAALAAMLLHLSRREA
jgi:lantibiotic transport system permease protein